MIESNGKRRKKYVDHPKDRSKLTCLIHDPGHSLDECRFSGYFGYKYSKIRSTKGRGHESETGIFLTDRKITIIFFNMCWMRSSLKIKRN